MSVKVRVSSLLRKFTDGREVVEVTGHSAAKCLHNLEVQFYVNGERILVDELNSPLEDNDDLLILLAIGGG